MIFNVAMKRNFTNSKKYLLLLLSMFFFVIQAHSQNSKTAHKNYVGISLTEQLFVDFRVSYERKINDSQGIIIALGYKPAFRYYTDATNINLGQAPTAWCYRNTANWYYVSLGYRYYFNKKKTIYASPELFYKVLQANNQIVYTWGIGNGTMLTNQYEVRAMRTNMIGANLLLGKKFILTHNDGFQLGFDIFCGLSLRSKFINTTIYGTATDTYYHDSPPRQVNIPVTNEPVEITENPFQPSFQFGVLLYGSWK